MYIIILNRKARIKLSHGTVCLSLFVGEICVCTKSNVKTGIDGLRPSNDFGSLQKTGDVNFDSINI